MSGAYSSAPWTERVQAEEARRTRRISRWALWLSVPASVSALAVSCLGLQEQRSINQDQRSINAEQRRVIEEARADKQVEHAIRVSWWESGGRGLIIQNRSVVPIVTVILRYRASFADPAKSADAIVFNGEGPVFIFDEIAPCTIITVDQEAIEEYYLGPVRERPESNYSGIRFVYWARIDFTDVHGRWGVTSGGGPESIESVDIADFDLEGSLILSDLSYASESEDWFVEQSASDCGSG